MKIRLDGIDSSLPTFEPIQTKFERLMQLLTPEEVAHKKMKKRREHKRRQAKGGAPCAFH